MRDKWERAAKHVSVQALVAPKRADLAEVVVQLIRPLEAPAVEMRAGHGA